jgi:hypothetical protein
VTSPPPQRPLTFTLILLMIFLLPFAAHRPFLHARHQQKWL